MELLYLLYMCDYECIHYNIYIPNIFIPFVFIMCTFLTCQKTFVFFGNHEYGALYLLYMYMCAHECIHCTKYIPNIYILSVFTMRTFLPCKKKHTFFLVIMNMKLLYLSHMCAYECIHYTIYTCIPNICITHICIPYSKYVYIY